MSPEQLLEKIKIVAEAFAQGQICKVYLNESETDMERARFRTQVDQWDRRVAQLWDELTMAVNSALPPTLYALPDPLAPVATPNDNGIEIRGTLGERAVVIRLTGAQAVPIGTTLIACAAVVTDRAGTRIAAIMPSIPASPSGQPVRPA
jgi:hypothetical protein